MYFSRNWGTKIETELGALFERDGLFFVPLPGYCPGLQESGHALLSSHPSGTCAQLDIARFSPETAALFVAAHEQEGLNLGSTGRVQRGGGVVQVTFQKARGRLQERIPVDFQESDIRLDTWLAVNDQPTSPPFRLRFTERALKKLASDFAEGRSFLFAHNTRMPNLGRTFTGSLYEGESLGIDAAWVRLDTYMGLRDMKWKRPFASAIDFGELSEMSVGIGGGAFEPEEDEMGALLLIDHTPERPLHARETSAVYKGRIHGAGKYRRLMPHSPPSAVHPLADWPAETVVHHG